MTDHTLILGIDSGLDGAFAWYYGGRIVHHVLTRTLVVDGAISMRDLGSIKVPYSESRIAYLEEPFNNAISGGASTAGYTDQCKRWGRLQGWLESWGYEVRGVQAKTWQRELLDLARFEVRTEVACKPRLAEGFTLARVKRDGVSYWRLRGNGVETFFSDRLGSPRAKYIEALALSTSHSPIEGMEGAITRTKTIVSHDTKAASLAYVREHYPDLNLIPPRARNPHDGLADAVCIAVWGSTQVKET